MQKFSAIAGNKGGKDSPWKRNIKNNMYSKSADGSVGCQFLSLKRLLEQAGSINRKRRIKNQIKSVREMTKCRLDSSRGSEEI